MGSNIILRALSFLCLIKVGMMMLECDENCRKYDSDRPTLVVKDTTGRLGNAIFSYQVLLALQLGFGYEAYMGERINRTLAPYFDSLRIPVGSKEICGFEELEKWIKNHLYETKSNKIERLIIEHTGQKPNRDSAGKLIISREDIIKYNIDIDGLVHSDEFTKFEEIIVPDSRFPWKIWQNQSLTGLKNDELKIGKAFILYPGNFKISLEEHKMMTSVPNMALELDKDLKMRDKYLLSAQATMQRVFKKFVSLKKKRKTYKSRDIIYVGIHSRRTDHLALERVNGYKEIKPSYFLEAMHLFTKHFGDKVIFLYVSDDLDWGIKYLGPKTKKSGNLYFVGEGHGTKEDSIGHDLAIMKSCNHTIITHGTFSYWAGFLSNGIVVLPDHIHQFRANNEMREGMSDDPINNPMERLYKFI